jgi:hypothetical protein
MSDTLRMIDLAPLSRNLSELRGIDPERQTLADRMAARAAVKHLERAHEDIGAAEGSAKARVDDYTEHDQERRNKGRQHASPPEDDRKAEPIPEREEGRLLDITA